MSINGFGTTNLYEGRYSNIPSDKENVDDIYDIDLEVTASQVSTPHSACVTHTCATCNTGATAACGTFSCFTCFCRTFWNCR
jgi:hypothetical protein